MSVPDIILPIDSTGLQAWVWIEAVELTRQGKIPVPGGDAWQVALPLRASLAQNNALLLDGNGKELPAPVPDSVRTPAFDVALYLHHPEVQAVMEDVRTVCLKILTKQLLPAQQGE